MSAIITRFLSFSWWSSPHHLVPRVVVIALLTHLLLSPQLWIPSGRTFPMTSLLASFPVVYGLTGDLLLLALLLIGMLLLWLLPTARFGLLLMTIALVAFILEDIVRLQPWIWFYALVLWFLPRPPSRRSFQSAETKQGSALLARRAIFPQPADTNRLRRTLILILGGLHLWSGVFKLNPAFVAEVVPQFLEPFGLDRLLGSLPEIGFLIPLLEIAGGLLLLFRPTRRSALVTLGVLHLLVALLLLLAASNTIVIPWNVAVALLLCFCDAPRLRLASGGLSAKEILAILVVWILPGLRLVGLNDTWLSGELYSGNATGSLFYFHESDRDNLPAVDSLYHFYLPDSEEELILIDGWCLDDLNVPFYPEERYHRRLAATLCEQLGRPEEGGMRISRRAPFTSRESVVVVACGE